MRSLGVLLRLRRSLRRVVVQGWVDIIHVISRLLWRRELHRWAILALRLLCGRRCLRRARESVAGCVGVCVGSGVVSVGIALRRRLETPEALTRRRLRGI